MIRARADFVGRVVGGLRTTWTRTTLAATLGEDFLAEPKRFVRAGFFATDVRGALLRAAGRVVFAKALARLDAIVFSALRGCARFDIAMVSALLQIFG